MTEEKQERALGLSPAQVAGSAIAAATAALLASMAGTTGTIIGAAMGSVVATVGAAAYTWWLRRTSEAVRRRAERVRQTALLSGPLPRRVTDGPLRPGRRSRHGGEDPDALGDDGSGADSDVRTRLLSWRKVALATAAVLVATLGGITAVEAITGRPLSSLIGQNDSTGTTLGNATGDEEPVPPAQERSEPAEPSQQPEPTEETQAPEPEQTEDTEPETPASEAPAPTLEPDAGTEAPEGVTGE